MALYFIYAYPNTYGGLNGMYNYELAKCNSEEEACKRGYELAHDTVESYMDVDEILSHEDYMNLYHNGAEWDERYEDNYWDAYEEVMEEECCFEIYSLKENITEKDYENWQQKNMPPSDFIEQYCKKNIDDEEN